MKTKAIVGYLIQMKSAMPMWQRPIVRWPPMNRKRLEKAFAEYSETTDEMKLKTPIKYVPSLGVSEPSGMSLIIVLE